MSLRIQEPAIADSSDKARSIEFLSGGLILRGVLRLPHGEGPHPIVILGHGLGALKEWAIPDVVEAFLGVGIAGLSFDPRNYGDSEGEPREEIAHHGRLDDMQSVISYAASLLEVDPERIGLWGTSLGGRDVLVVAGIDRRVKAVVLQTPLIRWAPSRVAQVAGYGSDVERFQRGLAEDHENRVLAETHAISRS